MTWGAQLRMRDSLIVVVHVSDTSTATNTELMLEPLTQILLFSPNQPVPLLILRTSMRSERQLDVDVELPKSAGFLHKIEHVQVNVAESRDSAFVVQVRGYTMRRMRVSNSEQMMWNLPEKACVRCVVNPNIMSADSASIDCTSPCVGHDGSAANEETEFEFVSRHMRVCLQEHTESIEEQNVCTDSIMLPRYLPETAVGQDSSAMLKLITLNNGNFIARDIISVPANVVAMLRVDTLQRTYRDMQNNVQAKVSLLSRMHYMKRADLFRLRSLTASDLDETIAAVVLEIICANARDVHGGWLHVLQLHVDRQGARGALRSSFCSGSHGMQCAHVRGLCAFSGRARH